MKKGLYIVFGIVSLLLISNVIAYQSTITVKTGLPNKDIIFIGGEPLLQWNNLKKIILTLKIS